MQYFIEAVLKAIEELFFRRGPPFCQDGETNRHEWIQETKPWDPTH